MLLRPTHSFGAQIAPIKALFDDEGFMRARNRQLAVVLISLAMLAATATAQEVLPRPEPPFKGKIGRTVKDSTPDFPKGVEAPKGAPNILLILTDDAGFGARDRKSVV